MNHIREYRLREGLTQVEMAKAMNISQGALSGYETGRWEPDMETMIRIAKYFNASLDDLFGPREDVKDKPTGISDVEFALSGEIHDLTDEEKADLLDYLRFLKSKRNRK